MTGRPVPPPHPEPNPPSAAVDSGPIVAPADPSTGAGQDSETADAIGDSAAERLLDSIIRWRAPLRVGLALLITAGVVGAFALVVLPDPAPSAITADGATAAPTELGAAAPAATDEAEPGAAVDEAPDQRAVADEDEARPIRPGVTDDDSPAGPTAVSGGDNSTTTTSSPAPRAAPTSLSVPPAPAHEPNPSIAPTTTAIPATSPLVSITGSTVLDATPAPSAVPTTTATTGLASTTTSTTLPPATQPAEFPVTSLPDATTTTTQETDGGADPAPGATTSTVSTTAPPPSTPQPDPVRVEAESGTLLGTAAARADHEGFSGAGFVGDLITEGSGVELVVTAPASGPTPFTVRYAAGNNGPEDQRTLTVFVDGELVTRAHMAVTGDWSVWDIVVGELDLTEGVNTVTLVWEPGDTGWVNLDYVQLH